MPDKWEELLPFYAAGTLDPAQKTAVEKHLDGCEPCRRSLNEWHLIGEAVRSEAESWARTMPLPRYNGQFGTAPPTGRHKVYKRPNRSLAIATMAASFIVVFLLGGIIVYMATRIKPEGDTASDGNTGAVAIAATQTAMSAAFSGTLSATVTSTDLGLITNTSAPITPTPTFPIEFEPTRTANPAGIGAGGGTGNFTADNTPLPTPAPFSTPLYGCMARVAGSLPVNIYRMPSANEAAVDIMSIDGYLNVFAISGDGWYEVFAPTIQLPGWVWGGDILLVGADCNTLPLPTPTAVVTLGPCIAIGLTTLLMRPDPYEQAPITASISANTAVTVLALSDNSWAMVQAVDSTTGWVLQTDLSISGTCSDIPYIPGYAVTMTPIP